MNNLIKQKTLLKTLRVASPKLRQAIIKNADPPLVKALVEIIDNLLKGNIPLSPSQRGLLRKYKLKFRRLVADCCSRQNSKVIKNKTKATRLLVQTGGAFPLLLGLIAPLIAKAALGGAVAAAAGVATKKVLGS